MWMPSLTYEDRERCLGPKERCPKCNCHVSRDYCRQCDEFYSICGCSPSIDSGHYGHRNYYSETILYALQNYIKVETDIAKIQMANDLLEELSCRPMSDKDKYVLLRMEALIWDNNKVKAKVVREYKSGSWLDYIET